MKNSVVNTSVMNFSLMNPFEKTSDVDTYVIKSSCITFSVNSTCKRLVL